MRILHWLTTAGLAVVLAGCAEDVVERGAVERVLIGSGEGVYDTVEVHLRSLQRELIRALADADSASIGRLVSAGFTIHDTANPEAVPVSLGADIRSTGRAHHASDSFPTIMPFTSATRELRRSATRSVVRSRSGHPGVSGGAGGMRLN